MFCKHCGKSIPDDSIFCPHCGGKVVDGNIQYNQDLPKSYNTSNYSQPSSKKQNNGYEDTAGFWGIFLAFGLPVIGIIMYFATKDTRRNAHYYLVASIISTVFALIKLMARH